MRLTPKPEQQSNKKEAPMVLLASTYDQSKYFKAADLADREEVAHRESY